jgi:carotenoid cleavage dioxygenase-like enzyme
MPAFPESPWFTGVNAPSRAEVDIDDLEVIGTIPPQIDGGFYRTAADHVFPPKYAGDIPFNGDGWIALAATDTVTGLTELNLFAATDIANGPIATIKTPIHMKPAYHGNWCDGADIKAAGLPTVR